MYFYQHCTVACFKDLFIFWLYAGPYFLITPDEGV